MPRPELPERRPRIRTEKTYGPCTLPDGDKFTVATDRTGRDLACERAVLGDDAVLTRLVHPLTHIREDVLAISVLEVGAAGDGPAGRVLLQSDGLC